MSGARLAPRVTGGLTLTAALLVGLGAACSRSKPAEEPPRVEAAEPAAQLAFASGEVNIEEADGTRRAAMAGPLPPGGRLATRSGSRAVLTLTDGSRIEVGPNGQLAWDTQREQLVLTPGRSVVVSQPPAGKRPRRFTLAIKTPEGMMHIPDEGGEAAFDLGGKRARVEMRFGRLAFENRTGRRFELRVGDRIDLLMTGIEIVRSDGSRTRLDEEGRESSDQAAPTTAGSAEDAGTPAPAPAARASAEEGEPPGRRRPPSEDPSKPLPAGPRAPLVLPMAIDLRVFGDSPGQVSLTWPVSPEVALLEVARDHLFKQIIMAGVPSGDHVKVAPPRTGSLYWRVLDQETREIRRGKVKFYRDFNSDSASRGAKAVVSDIGGAAKLFYQRVVPVTFTYTSHPRAARYHLRVTPVAAGGRPVFDGNVREAQHTLKAGTLRDGQYVWTATPLDASGAPLGDPRENRLTINYDNATIDLSLSKPRRGERVRGPEVQVKGVAALESQLFVNGKRAPLDHKGRFDFRVSRSRALIFRLVTAEGETFWVRELRVGS